MAQSEVPTPKVVPEGQVYRQIFDAEVSLVESLEKERRSYKSKSAPVLPLVRESRSVTGHGILSRRQREWTQARLNDSYIENPVYYKYAALEAIERDSVPDNYEAIQEVRGLMSDLPKKSQAKSNIVEKIKASRKERHETTLEDMYQELAMISTDLEPRIIEASETLQVKLAENDKEIDHLMQLIEKDDDLIGYEIKDLHKLWINVAAHSSVRQSWIKDMQKSLEQVELDRSSLLRETLRSYDKTLERIAHLMPPDVHRMLEKEALHINSTILTNKRSCADLIAHLLSADIERERKCYIKWQTRVEDWRLLKCKESTRKFSEFMQSPPIKDPPDVQRELECFTLEQKAINSRRHDILESLRNLKPPNSTKSAVYQWHSSLVSLGHDLEELHIKYKTILNEEYEKVIQRCLEEVCKYKEEFIASGILDDVRIDEVLNEHFLPLVGEKQTKFEYEVEKMERSLENLTSFQEMLIKSLFKFVQGSAHLWDLHELGLAHQERTLQESLEKNRQDHDAVNQVKEANLDIVMDKMRQDSTQTALTVSLNQAMALLKTIKQMYHDFHNAQVETACSYPAMVQEELKTYDSEICKYFQVNRNPPKELGKGKAAISPHPQRQTKVGHQALEDILTTSNGTSFYILKEPGEHGLPDTPESIRSMKTCMTFLTENSDAEDTASPYLDAISIKEELFVELRKHVRMEFLEHLEKWKEQALEHSNSVVSAKMEELNSELDLRLHLHEPRAARAQQDVHNVRAAELILHRDRVDQHCKGVVTTLNEFKTRFHEMVEEHDKETEYFKRSVQELEATFVSATKTHELLAIQDQVTNRVEQYMDIIRSSIRSFRHDLDGILSTLRNSNARFRKTFKVFSDGGNFSTDEIDEYRKRLEKMASRIDSSEGSFMGELEGMETKRLEAATDYAGKLEDRFKHHLFDLTYIEKITRWLTNIQVKVKSEVAFSNSQAKKLAVFMATFDRHIDAVEKPNLDKEQVTAREVQASLIPILQAFHERCVYLNALLNDATPSLNVLRSGIKVGFSDEKNADQKDKQSAVKPELKSRKSKKKQKSVQEIDVIEEENKPKTSPLSMTSSKSLDDEDRPKTVPSDLKRTDIEKVKSAGRTRKTSGNKKDQGPKYDKKYLIFGEVPDDGEHFLAKINNILREGLEGLLATAEMYYRQKGLQRLPTRPKAIQENFDACAEILVQRLLSYKTQAEDYHNSCIQELRSQLQKFSTLIVRVPPLAINVVLEEQMKELENKREQKRKEYQQHRTELDQRKQQYQSQLRPSLGHPHNRNEMDSLCQQEIQRTTEANNAIRDHADTLMKMEVQFGASFVEKLAHICETMLLQFDAVLTIDDVLVGVVEPKPKTTKQLLRDKIAGGEENKDKLEPFPSGSATWDGLPTNEFDIEQRMEKITRTPTIKTVKTTQAHFAAIKARDKAYEEYKSKFFAALVSIKEKRNAELDDEAHWSKSWQRSTETIKNLY
ncbi:coiled-coil domain-containing protein 180-like [Actinia tenebrosa]|uniref:Coiled-coil domain-containing protein 180-like n=1 Tax=Actinia tenebrosa TaxID=6105 RepID=A0A6P8HS79_ACTTE|nr:coiled-coil domain-containing protein 180-like [Actinia tenebrosa]